MATKQITTKLKLSQRKEWRIAIAKDVLKYLRTLTVERGGYIDGMFDFESCPIQGSVQKNLSRVKQNCSVCALGSMMLSFVKFHNQLDLSEIIINDYYPGRNKFSVSREQIVNICKLGKFFSRYQLDLIEMAFEGYQAGSEDLTKKDEDAAIIFNRIYLTQESDYDDKEVLRAIMKNIVKNDGEFCPAQDKLVIAEIKKEKQQKEREEREYISGY